MDTGFPSGPMLLHYRPVKAQSCCREERQKEDHRNDGVANEQDFDKYGDPKMEHDDDDEVPAYTTRRSSTTLPKGRPFKRRTPFMKNKGKKIVNR